MVLAAFVSAPETRPRLQPRVVDIIYSSGLVKLRVEKEGYVPWDEIMDVYVGLEPVKAQETPSSVKTPPLEDDKAKPEEKGICGPTALLAMAMLPLGIRRLLKSNA